MTQTTTTTPAEEDFNFSHKNFRAMGFQYTGIVKECRVQQPKEATFTFVDKKTGESRTLPSKPQLHMLIEPTDHTTKSGNPYPEYFPLSQNIRSKLGIFVDHLQKLGIDLGTNPAAIEGRHFQFEVKEVSFGPGEPIRVTVPIGIVDALSAPAAKPAAQAAEKPAAKVSDDDAIAVAKLLDGKTKSTALAAVAGSGFATNPKIVAGIADGSLIRSLLAGGQLAEEDGTYRLAA